MAHNLWANDKKHLSDHMIALFWANQMYFVPMYADAVYLDFHTESSSSLSMISIDHNFAILIITITIINLTTLSAVAWFEHSEICHRHITPRAIRN